MSNIFYESTLFEYVEPNWLLFIESTFTPNDPRLAQQWYLNRIQALSAWNITQGGCPNIRIAVVDDGVDLTHPELQANLEPGMDFTNNNTNGGTTLLNNRDPHGTACAGILGARGNNGQGGAGVAHNCRVIPIKAFTEEYTVFGNDTVTTSLNFDAQQFSITIANAIDWAWDVGRADIINMSFRVFQTPNILQDAVNRAATEGRVQGNFRRGTLLVGASGNGNYNSLFFPARYENVIAVGSSNQNDTRSSFSNYGIGLDITAPGEIIYTTDRQGVAGYTANNEKFNFSGTSAATPVVSGTLALILSVNPYLTMNQARQILEQNADKVGGYNYQLNGNQPNGTWHQEMGYSRVNADRAVRALLIQDPSEILCNPATATYTLPFIPAEIGIQWQVSQNLDIISGQGTSTIQVRRKSGSLGNGTAYVEVISYNPPAGYPIPCQLPLPKEILGFPDPSKISLNRFGQNCFNGESRELLGVGYDGVALHEQYYSGLPAPPNGTQGILEVECNFSPSYGSMQLIQPTARGLSCGTSHNIICRTTAQIRSMGDAGGVVLVRVRNCVGWSGWRQFPIYGVNCYSIYPCGRVGQFSVVVKSKDDKSNALTELVGENIDFEAKLYDLNGNVVKEGKSKGKHRIDWDTSDLKEGQYILRTVFNGEVRSQHVLVNSACCGGGGGC